MEKILLAFLVAIVIGTIFSIFLIILGIKIKNIFLPGILVSDLILFIFYKDEIINNLNSNDLFYIFIYFLFSILFLIIYIIYLFISISSNRCICKLYRKSSYEEIKEDPYNNNQRSSLLTV